MTGKLQGKLTLVSCWKKTGVIGLLSISMATSGVEMLLSLCQGSSGLGRALCLSHGRLDPDLGAVPILPLLLGESGLSLMDALSKAEIRLQVCWSKVEDPSAGCPGELMNLEGAASNGVGVLPGLGEI